METTIMENQMKKKMENEMETAIYRGYVVHIITTSPPKALNSNEAGGFRSRLRWPGLAL